MNTSATETTNDSQVIEQIRLLGYQDGEKVFYRALDGNTPRKLSAIFPNIPSELKNLNDAKFDIYVVVNGGDKDADVTAGKAIFYEHDDLPKKDQLDLWQSLELPVPTFQVDTGNKSIHSYWVFDGAIAVDRWKTLQTDLLNHSNGDRSIKNPSRIMRLAGYKHQKTGQVASIANKFGAKYSYDELREVVPPTTTTKVVKEKKPKNGEKLPLAITHPSSSKLSIPLEKCLAESNRELLRGAIQGGRNVAGAALARDLIGAEEYLKSKGIPYKGDARSLFDNFCQICTPPIGKGPDDHPDEPDTIWDSAMRDNPEPSCHPDAIANILNAWYKEHDPNYVEPEEKRKLGYYSSEYEGLVCIHMGKNADGFGVKVRTKVGNHLVAIAVVDSPEQNQAALQLEFKNFQGIIRRVVILRSDLAGDGTAIVSTLLGLGYAFKRKQKPQLLDYIHGLGRDISKKYTITDVAGWTKNSFVMPHKTYGNTDVRFRDIEPSDEVLTEIEGTLADWQTHIASKCGANSRPIFAMGVAFAAPLLPVVGMESGGFHLVGGTSQGKTTTLKIATSVTGEKQIPSWRATTNGLESVATAHSGLMLPLDEIGQSEPREVGNAAYLLGNGQSKTRMTKRLTNQKVKTWKLLVLSSGELGLAQYLAQAQIVMKGGQEVRMCDLPAVPKGSAFGVFETIHGADSSKQFAQDLEAATEKYRGIAIDAYLTRLVADRSSKFDSELTSRVFALSRKLAKGTTDHAVSRVANRFALVQVGLELAHSYEILPFDVKHIEWAVKKMFDDWLDSRGGDGSIEIKNACERIELLIISNEHSDRFFDPRKDDGQIVRNLLGYKVADSFDNDFKELLVPTSIFDKEYCQGVDKKALIAELQARGWLAASGGDGRPTHNRRVVGKKQGKFLVFCIDRVRNSEKNPVAGVAGVAGAENGSESELENQNPATPTFFTGVAGVAANYKNILPPCDEGAEKSASDDDCDDDF